MAMEVASITPSDLRQYFGVSDVPVHHGVVVLHRIFVVDAIHFGGFGDDLRA